MYAVKVQCKEARYQDGGIAVSTDDWAWIVNSEWGLTAMKASERLPNNLWTTSSKSRAISRAKNFKGHPWYIKPNGSYKVVKIKKVTKRVFSHYRKA